MADVVGRWSRGFLWCLVEGLALQKSCGFRKEFSMTSQAARDLLWAINSPSLIRMPSQQSPGWPVCEAADVTPESLQNFCDQQARHRVGQYFEDLVHFYLKAVRNYEIVEHGLQIQEGGRTVGELDFLYRTADGNLHHCETAVKFYLYIPESNDSGSQFIGPNAADNFERKTLRLFEHQLRLSEDRFPSVVKREAFVKGRIFYHPQREMPEVLPVALAPDHLRGVWIRESELEWLRSSDAETKFRVARKPYWLSPDVASLDESELRSADEICGQLRQHFTERRTPQLINALIVDDNFWRESRRIFVVSDQWPNDAR